MIYMYEKACREEGLSQEEAHKIHNAFHVLYQAKYRERKAREQSGYEFLSLEGMYGPDGEVGSYDVEDPSMNVEEIVMHNMQLERLHEVLNMIDEVDRCFILEYFQGQENGKFLDDLCVRYGLSKKQANTKMHKIIDSLRELF